MTSQTRYEFEQLLSALCDGTLDEKQHARLQELLTADADCRLHYLEYIDLHARLLVHPSHQTAGTTSFPELPITPAKPPAAPRRRGQIAARYAAIVVTTLVVSLALQWLWTATHPQPVDLDLPDPIATLAQTHDCQWHEANTVLQNGSRLRPGEMRLIHGLARLRFDGGPELILEGPATIRLDSTAAAMLVSGKVVFRADNTAQPFELRTPDAVLIDLGTEYAVSVAGDAEEVHVFEGEVQRTPNSTKAEPQPEHISAGESRRFARGGATGESAKLDSASFARQMPESLLSNSAGLLAYEGFDYSDVDSMQKGTATGGIGWQGAWKPGFNPFQTPHKTRTCSIQHEGLKHTSVGSGGGCLDTVGYVRFLRQLSTPINMGDDGVYYVSFLFRRRTASAEHMNSATIVFRPTDVPAHERDDFSKRLTIGVGGPNHLFVNLLHICARVPLPLSNGQTYILVAKIVTSRSRSNQIMVSIQAADDPISAREPGEWTLTTKPFHSDLVFPWLEVGMNSMRHQQVDEIRVGTSWTAVTSATPGK